MNIDELILEARRMGASDIHLSENMPMMVRINGRLIQAQIQPDGGSIGKMIMGMMSGEQKAWLSEGNDVDFALTSSDGNRQRINVYRHMYGLAATIRLLNNHIPNMKELGLPAVLESMARQPRGLILVTGPTGSGKSTTLAAMVDYINSLRTDHILTIEDPIEYVYTQKLATIHQREVGRDTVSFASALRSALREDPDVILVGEMRDYETISAAVTAAETGHLVLSTLHTTGAAQTIDRIIDACPPNAQNQIRIQLAGILKGIVTQCLIETSDGRGRTVATEVLVGTDAVLNMIRENKGHQMQTSMQSGAASGMHTLNSDLARLVMSGKILKEMAFKYSNDTKELEQYLM